MFTEEDKKILEHSVNLYIKDIQFNISKLSNIKDLKDREAYTKMAQKRLDEIKKVLSKVQNIEGKRR